jgi:C-terminal processing protease CtpA/Prc
MAVKYKDLKQKLETEGLTNDELKYVDAAEKYIDSQLTERFDNSEIRIEMNVFEFTSSRIDYPSTIINIKNTRKAIMRQELERRFKAAGWNLKEEFWDGHSMGFDYMIFTGKD